MANTNDYRQQVLDLMPYGQHFCFVDQFLDITETTCIGQYTYKKEEWFYPDHFPGRPVTPGVILIETMAQIGLVGLGIFLHLKTNDVQKKQIAFASSDVVFLAKVLPGETITVHSQKIFFRLGKLKCNVEAKNESGKTVAKGVLSGMILRTP